MGSTFEGQRLPDGLSRLGLVQFSLGRDISGLNLDVMLFLCLL